MRSWSAGFRRKGGAGGHDRHGRAVATLAPPSFIHLICPRVQPQSSVFIGDESFSVSSSSICWERLYDALRIEPPAFGVSCKLLLMRLQGVADISWAADSFNFEDRVAGVEGGTCGKGRDGRSKPSRSAACAVARKLGEIG